MSANMGRDKGGVMRDVVLVVRQGCGSCVRVEQQIAPVVQKAQANFRVVDISEDSEIAMEFGDRVPVVLVDEEEFSAWEVDSEELLQELQM